MSALIESIVLDDPIVKECDDQDEKRRLFVYEAIQEVYEIKIPGELSCYEALLPNQYFTRISPSELQYGDVAFFVGLSELERPAVRHAADDPKKHMEFHVAFCLGQYQDELNFIHFSSVTNTPVVEPCHKMPHQCLYAARRVVRANSH